MEVHSIFAFDFDFVYNDIIILKAISAHRPLALVRWCCPDQAQHMLFGTDRLRGGGWCWRERGGMVYKCARVIVGVV